MDEGYYKGYTALHLAVATCNNGAVSLLLEEKELDTSLLTEKKYSAMDLALINLGNQVPAMNVYDVPEEARDAEDMKHWTRAFEIHNMLLHKRIPANLFFGAAVKTEPGTILYISSERGGPLVVMPSEWNLLFAWSRHDRLMELYSQIFYSTCRRHSVTQVSSKKQPH